MHRNRLRSFVCAWTAAAVAVGGCRTPVQVVQKPAVAAPADVPATAPVARTGRPSVTIDTAEDGKLTLALGEAALDVIAPAVTTLSPAETQALLARLEPMPPVDSGAAPIVRPPSAPPPRMGDTQPIAFLAPAGQVIADRPVSDAPAGTVAPLQPPQILPVGEVAYESEIRVRFAEAMVPITAVPYTTTTAPATIKPAVDGTWRWIDTRVATFTAKAPRLPQATEFTVTVPAGTRAINGATLAVEQTAKFSTPPVKITGTYPTVKLRPDSPLLVGFDQQVDDKAIAKFLRVEDGRKRKLAFETIGLDEARARWANNPAIEHDNSALPDHYVILAPNTAWPSGISGRVVLGKGAPSREGARMSTEDTGASFQVAPAFAVSGLECDNGSERPRLAGVVCPARSYVTVKFSNEIEIGSYRSSKVQIEGQPLEDHQPVRDGATLDTPREIGKTFTIAIGDGITDIYGQALGGPKRLAFTTKRERHESWLYAHSGLYILDPRFEIPQWTVNAQAVASVHIELYQVEPADYFAFEDFEARKRPAPPGKRVYVKDHEIGARHGALARVDLRPALSAAGTGHVIAVATARPLPGKKLDDRRVVAWIQVSRLGITARIDGERLNAWTLDITPASFLKPIAGAETSLLVEGRTDAPAAVATDREGHAAYELLAPKPRARADQDYPTSLLVARSPTESTFAAVGRYEKTVRTHQSRWYVTDDRFTYKPGETVYVKGWVRWTDNGVNPDLHVPDGGDRVAYTLTDSRGNRIASGNASFTQQGGFDLEVALPANVNLGTATFAFETKQHAYRHPISIEEFRTPAYAVNLADDVHFSGARALVLGESIEMSAEAKYFAGGGLAGSRIAWDATLQSATYRPPGWERYSFSRVRPRSQPSSYYWHEREYGGTTTTVAHDSGTLSGASTSSLTVGIAALPRGAPSILTVDATVTDIDRQTIRASSRKIVVHPSTLYVGLRQKPETTDTLQLVVTDIDGNAVPDVPISVAIEGVLGSEAHRDDANVIDTQSCKLVSAREPVTCSFTRKDRDTAYSAVARIADSRGRANEAQFRIPWWTTSDRDLAVVPDKQSYKPGDVANIEIRSKQLPGVAVVSFARQGIVIQKRVELTHGRETVELPIEPAYTQNVYVVVDRLAKRRHQSSGSRVPLPELTSVEVDLPVDVEAARLGVRTRALQPLIEPGDSASFEVEVKHDDKPLAGAEVALVVVDEAILSISGKQHADPLAPFYRHVHDGTTAMSTMMLVQDAPHEATGKPGFERWSLDDMLSGHGSGSGYGSGSGRGGMSGRSVSAPAVRTGQAMVKARKDFRPTAVFSPRLATDEHGKVRVTVKMPDSLTRYRIVALATARTRYFGKAESNIVTQRKLNARTVAPRFLTQGDTFSLPVVVQNLDSAARTIDVAVRAANLTGVGPAGKRVTVGGGQRAEVRFEFATKSRGRAVIQTIAVSNSFADASNVELPVYEPATTESFATYGSVEDKPHFERLSVPANVFPEVGGVEAEVSSTQMQNLTDAFWYLYAYPFECAEQRSSRMIATAAMYDILDAFAVPGRPTKQELDTTRAVDVKRLTRDQLDDGGWGYFYNMKSDPFVSMQVLTALAAQKDRSDTTKRAIGYVTKQATTLLGELAKRVKARDVKLRQRPAIERDDDAATISLAATALSALAATGADVTARMLRLHAAAIALGTYPVDAKARVLAAIAGLPRHAAVREKLLADLLSAVHETAAAATVTASFTEAERMLLVSNHKTTALALDALLREQPRHAVVIKLARGLLDGRRGGRWRSTQENVVVLQALRRYFDIYEKDTPNYTGKLWLGTAAYTEQTFAGRSNLRGVAHAGWSLLQPGSTHEIALSKLGAGRMYFRLGITYAPKDTKLPPLDAGFIVRRTYKAVDAPSDVVQLPDGRWKIKLGARVLVQLEAINTTARHAVALVDPLPAGFEAVNTRLATSERAVIDLEADRWDHTNMRDNRSEAFKMHLPEGGHRFSYTARATTPGTFIAAPAKAEEMYSPETFGRSAGTTVVIE